MNFQIRSRLTSRPAIVSKTGRRHYLVEIYIDGPREELDKVREVSYLLHPTFKDPIRTSARGPHFPVEVRTYAPFSLVARIRTTDDSYAIEGQLELPFREFENLKPKPIARIAPDEVQQFAEGVRHVTIQGFGGSAHADTFQPIVQTEKNAPDGMDDTPEGDISKSSS